MTAYAPPRKSHAPHAGPCDHAHHDHHHAGATSPSPAAAKSPAGRAHDHRHSHDHGASCSHGHHHHGANSSARTLTFALLLTLGFAAVELVGGLVTGSLALLGDAGHMLSDSLSLAIAAAAARIALRPPTARHSYGFGRIEALAALTNGVLMLAIVAGITWEAITRLRNPEPIDALPAVAIAASGFLVNLVAAWMLMRGERSLNVRGALIHVIGDLLGSVAAIIGLLVVHFTGWQAADPIISVLICALILGSTATILREAFRVLLDGVPSGLSLEAVGQCIAAIDGVRSVHDLHVWHYAPGRVALSAHLLLDDSTPWPAVLVAVRQRVKNEFSIEHLTLQPELPGQDHFPLAKIGRQTKSRTN
ncbi:cation diffusion facilitator family transporter [Niveibacterium sp. 24ML]|uniref:cation diffusion facilitator family transporter n=1 Tax=Niveibacterium sp. 24ML TaxID=2985512 RepID=UPI00226E7F3C|nr:cation diffusion facilitator family transporter [Niveibacterium sp. 24ML]MCX9156115.1 cation diffusion facilitator family transporter [Niveibacterium sp. 24ML]